MSAQITVHTRPGVDLSNAMVVVGAPTLGFVGTITAHYLVQSLDMPLAGGFHSSGFPPVSKVSGGRPSLPIRMHVHESACGWGTDCDRLVVVVAEFLPGLDGLYAFSEALTRWCIENGSTVLVAPDGFVVPGPDEGDVLRGVAALDRGLKMLETIDVEPMDDGVVAGLSGALLFDGERLGMNTLSLMAESSPAHPDARAAARLVEALDRVIPDTDIGTAPLLEEAEQIEAHVQRLREQLEEHAATQAAAPDSPMYR